MPVVNDHPCNQGPRFDSLEHSLEGIHETLKALTKLIIDQAASDTKLSALTETVKDHEARIRVVEKHQAKNLWLERVVWILVAAALTAYFNLK